MINLNVNEIQQVLVIGAGTMGHSIAQVYAQSGIKVDLVDLKQEILNSAIKKIKFIKTKYNIYKY